MNKQGKMCRYEYEEPSQLEKFMSLSSALFKHTMGGLEITPEHIKEERLTICKECPLYNAGSCLKCGCVLSIKTGWATEECPLDPPKWKKYEQEGKGCGCG